MERLTSVGFVLAIFVVAIVLFICEGTAAASLGGDVSSVQADQARLKATIQVHDAQGYTVQEMQPPGGTSVKEYLSSDGRVFAVSWRGPFLPDMQQILGSYFQQYSTAVHSEKAKRTGRAPLNIQQSGLVVQSGGHMRAYFGRAYIPGMLPAGVTPDEIK